MKIFETNFGNYNGLNCNLLLLMLNNDFRKTKYKNKQMANLSAIGYGDYERNRQKRGIKKLRALQKKERDESFTKKDVDWFGLLDYTKKGNIRKTLKNKATILTNDPKLSVIVYNEQSEKIWLSGETPWSLSEKEFKESDFVGLKYYFSKYYNLECSDKLYDAVLYVSRKRGYNPIKDYLTKLPVLEGDKLNLEDKGPLFTNEKKNLC